MAYQIAIARFRELPTIFTTRYATVEAATAAAERDWRDGLRSALDAEGALPVRFAHRPTGDLYVIPARPEAYEYISSAQVRSIAAVSLAGRNWRTAFTDAEIAAWELAKEAAFA